MLELAQCTVGPGIVAQARAAGLDRIRKHGLDLS